MRGQGVGNPHYSQYAYLPEQLSAFQGWDSHIADLKGRPATNVDTTLETRRAGKRQKKQGSDALATLMHYWALAAGTLAAGG